MSAWQDTLRTWTRPRTPEPLPTTLTRQRIYVLPTRTGLFFAVLLLAMLMGALNFNNNPALLLALLLSGAALASLIAAHMQLSGICINAVHAEPVAAGNDLLLRIAMECKDQRRRQGLRIDSPSHHGFAEFNTSTGSAEVALATHHRGLLAIPKLTLSTVQPLGLARAWSHVWPQQTVLVYPAAETQAPPLPLPTAGTSQHAQPARTGDDPHHLRDYLPGDAPRTVAWKASAKFDKLLVRDFEQARGSERVLDWQHTAGLPYEQRIRRLARWVDDAEREGGRYALQLPNAALIPMGSGAQQRHHCLRALALLPAESVHG
jgi:uncharacterized protein (DUF58 family)